MGKPIKSSIGEMENGASWLSWHIEHAPKFLKRRVLDVHDTYQTELHFDPYSPSPRPMPDFLYPPNGA